MEARGFCRFFVKDLENEDRSVAAALRVDPGSFGSFVFQHLT